MVINTGETVDYQHRAKQLAINIGERYKQLDTNTGENSRLATPGKTVGYQHWGKQLAINAGENSWHQRGAKQLAINMGECHKQLSTLERVAYHGGTRKRTLHHS